MEDLDKLAERLRRACHNGARVCVGQRQGYAIQVSGEKDKCECEISLDDGGYVKLRYREFSQIIFLS